VSGASPGVDADEEGIVIDAAPKKIKIDEMIAEVVDHLSFLERDVYFAEQEPGKCNVPRKKRRLAAFMQIMSTLELVELFEPEFIAMIRAGKATAKKSVQSARRSR